MPGLVFLHASHAIGWDAWHFEPTVVGGTLIVLGLYGYALTREGNAPDWRRLLLFSTGAVALFVGLVSPLDAGAERLLSLHMLQHVLLTTIGPPLVLLGLPREGLQRFVLRAPAVGRVLRFVTAPLLAAPLFIVNMWLWHLPPVYDAALSHLSVHVAMHVAFIATGFIFWWPVIEPLPAIRRVSEGAKLLYLFVSGFPMALLALLLLSSGSVIYSYYESAPRLWGISALIDQQVAGLIMGGLGELASFVAISLLFLRFLGREEESDAPFSRESIDAV